MLFRSQGQLNYGSSAASSAQSLAMEYFMSKAGIKLVSIPYKGGAGAATLAVLAGEVTATMLTTASFVPHLKGGKVKVLAVISPKGFVVSIVLGRWNLKLRSTMYWPLGCLGFRVSLSRHCAPCKWRFARTRTFHERISTRPGAMTRSGDWIKRFRRCRRVSP